MPFSAAPAAPIWIRVTGTIWSDMDPIGTDVVPADGGASTAEDDRWRDDPSEPIRQPLPRWPFIVAGTMLAFAAIIFVLWRIDVAYFALSPGPVSDVGDHVVVEGGTEEEAGELIFLTVSLKEVTALEAIAAWLDPEVDLTPTESIRPAGVTPEELRRQNLGQMELSQQTAIAVALERAGYEVILKGNGALVSAVVDGGAATGKLEANDVIVAVNGAPIEFSDDAVAAISGFRPGETLTLGVRRPTDEAATEFEEFEVQVILGVFMGVDENGNEVIDEDRGMVGVLLGNFNVETVLPLDIEIDSENIGGPSAGMMFTLEIINQLSEEDLTHGHIVAGTGTIDRDGHLGEIGGIRQKVFAAIAAGADFVLVPSGNVSDATSAAGEDIEVIRVESIDQALAFFETL